MGCEGASADSSFAYCFQGIELSFSLKWWKNLLSLSFSSSIKIDINSRSFMLESGLSFSLSTLEKNKGDEDE